MSEKKDKKYFIFFNQNHVHMDCDKIIDEIQSNNDNPYIKFPDYRTANDIGFYLGFYGCDNDYAQMFFENDEKMEESQRFKLMAFKQGIKEGVILGLQNEAELLEKQKIEDLKIATEKQNNMQLLTYAILNNLLKKD